MLQSPWTFVLVAFLTLTTTAPHVTASLSIPTASDKIGQRAEAIALYSALIENEPRTFSIGDQVFPFYNGPIPRPGSLAEYMTLQESAMLQEGDRGYSTYASALSASYASMGKLDTMEEMVAIYDDISQKIEKPLSLDISDVNFGRRRMTVTAAVLRQVRGHEYTETAFELSSFQLADLCGSELSWETIRDQGALFVEDFATISQWNDPEQPHKYAANVVGFFCYNKEKQQLLPVEIHFPDTGLVYSSQDTTDEWTLAKIALNVASANYHQFQHYVETHAINVPVRVEIYRNMAKQHPVGALLLPHMQIDFGLELLLDNVLLSPDTPLDLTFGFGATGATRFLYSRIAAGKTYTLDLPEDILVRGLGDIPTHQYATYGTRLHNVIDNFVGRYVGAFYIDDQAVENDFELQNWVRACSKVPHLVGFPDTIQTREELQSLLTSLLYRSMVKHHSMNGEATWHSVSVPYAPTALWHPLPTKKQSSPESEPLRLTDFTVPTEKLHLAMSFSGLFYRPPMANQTVIEAFRVPPFSEEPRLALAIEEYEAAMNDVEAFIQEAEGKEESPYLVLSPSHLPFTTWI